MGESTGDPTESLYKSYSPNSPYARKARIIIHELELKSRVQDMIVSLPADAKLRAINPLGKIPALLLDDG